MGVLPFLSKVLCLISVSLLASSNGHPYSAELLLIMRFWLAQHLPHKNSPGLLSLNTIYLLAPMTGDRMAEQTLCAPESPS